MTLLTTRGREAPPRPLGTPGSEPLGNAVAFAVAALTFGAAAIHFAVVREHWQEWPLAGAFFLVLGVLQAGWAWAALHRPARIVLALGAVVQLEVIALWLVSRTAGLPFGPQAHVPEPVGVADVVCTVLETLSVLGVGLLLAPSVARRPLPRSAGIGLAGGTAVVVALATSLSLLPAAGGHMHMRVRGDIPAGWAAGCMHMAGGGHAAGACTDAPVTPAQRDAAERLVAATQAAVADRYPTLESAEADGYQLLNVDKYVVHVQRPDYQHDGHVLDPNRVESLVYVTYHGRSMLMGAMYMAEPTAPQGPLIGGALTSWHIHTNLCVDNARGSALDANPDHSCPAGSAVQPTAQMLHVWTRPYPGGPFADLTWNGASRVEKALKAQVNG